MARRNASLSCDDPRLDDLGEADQERQADAALAHLVHQLLEVDRRRARAARVDEHVALLADGEVVVPPAADVVEVDRVGGGPAPGQGSSGGHLGADTPLLPGVSGKSSQLVRDNRTARDSSIYLARARDTRRRTGAARAGSRCAPRARSRPGRHSARTCSTDIRCSTEMCDAVSPSRRYSTRATRPPGPQALADGAQHRLRLLELVVDVDQQDPVEGPPWGGSGSVSVPSDRDDVGDPLLGGRLPAGAPASRAGCRWRRPCRRAPRRGRCGG